jgi:putative lipoic acid-binding regulatory protein
VTDPGKNIPTDSLLEFPCQFPIKMMGRKNNEFQPIAIALVEKHAGEIAASAVRLTSSSNGKFVSVTVHIEARSQEQLDDIYRDLSACEDILVAL